ncbi:YhcN/YlaJ family sporulation lipoprotein [Paenibacillus sp. N4]|uniref:YhcN/YlaJ family sporulation lipoprotein n=1 Tax=Paenibacillus vietnamensis TaxID=2590547 RepID=UPI001CD0F973|nr:YhcN/YlaJ family sporulation lipoprotein [Paenibacillus vietnamensis]MCA0757777.1 YhcN/YlaJ family sporulation lipoprotein [Paenibacillus vietnamensis]
MVKRMAALLLTAAVLSAAAGCNYEELAQQSDTDYGSRQANDPKMLGERAYGPMTNNPHQHDNAFFEYSSAISNKVSTLNGVASAIVMLTDKNAYVGLMLDWSAVGTKNNGGTNEQDNTGTNEGVYNVDTGSPYGNSRALVYPYNSYFSVNDVNDLSNELKQTVAKQVRQLAPNVEEVHISANMELVNYFNEFAKEAWGGRSLMPWIDTFNTVIKYHFAGGKIMPPPLTQPGTVSPSESQMER